MGSMFSPSSSELQGRQTGLGAASSLAGAGQSLLRSGAGSTSAGTDYYKALMGSPQQIQAATAPAARDISDSYAGATAGVKAGYQQGAARDTTLGGLARDRTRAISGLYQGVQPAAAGALTSTGTTLAGQGIGAFTGAGQIGSGVASQAAQSSNIFGSLGLQSGAGLGNLLSQGLKTGLKVAGKLGT